MTRRVANFSPGPAVLPLAALEKAQAELLDYAGTGMSIIEHSHRGKEYEAVHNEAISLLRKLLAIPADYDVLFLQGGASQQFAVVPMNLLHPGQSADYVVTGVWAEKALEEAKLLGNARVAATTVGEGGRYTRVPKASEIDLDSKAAYVHITTNNTVMGTQFHEMPDTRDVPVVADMSSDILWKPIDVSKFGLIYAGAQKNIGIAGITVVILRKDLLERTPKKMPKLLRYPTYAENDSLQNTIPVFPMYMMRNVLRWVKSEGGATAMETRNRTKGDALYACIDRNAGFYKGPVEKDSRSYMNVVFRLPTEDLEKKFVAEAKKAGMAGLKGHRSAGGIRASIYNAIAPSDVETLVQFMDAFAKSNG